MSKEKVENWGVFVENQKGETFEVQLSEELSAEVYDFIVENLKECKLDNNTNGKIEW